MEVVLKYPIEYLDNDGITNRKVEKLSFQRLKAKHLKLLPKDYLDIMNGSIEAKDAKFGIDQLLPLISVLSGVPEIALGDIDVAEDLAKVVEAMGSFLK